MEKKAEAGDLLNLICFIRDNLANFSLNGAVSWNDVGWVIEGDGFPSFELYYSYDSSIDMHYGDSRFTLQPESILLLDNHVPNSCVNGKFKIFGFNYSINREHDPEGSLNGRLRELLAKVAGVPLACDASTARFVSDMEKDFHFNASECELSAFCGIIQVLPGAYRILTISNDNNVTYINSRGRKIVSNIAEHLISHPESNEKLEDIAKQFGLNHRYVNRLFKGMYGMPIQRYRCISKIKQAKRMLSISNMTMAEIASHLNFATDQYFNYVFQKEIGMSPNEYRKLNKTVYR